MTRLAATLGSTGIAAALMLAAFQLLPPRDGGTAQAGTEPPARAWADPPRPRAAPVATAAVQPAAAPVAERVQPVLVQPTPAQPAPVQAAHLQADPAAAPPEGRRSAQAGRAHRLAARSHSSGEGRLAMRRQGAQASAEMPAKASGKMSGQPAPVRMAGPIGDILHGLGLD